MDRSDIDLLDESIGEALREQCDSAAIHAFLGGKRDLAREMMQLAAGLGWLGIGIAEQHGGLGTGLAGFERLHRAIGRHTVPGPLAPSLIALQWLDGTARRPDVVDSLLAGELTAMVPAGVSGRLSYDGDRLWGGPIRMLGWSGSELALAPFRWNGIPGIAILRVDGDKASFAPVNSWDRTRMVGDLVCGAAQPIATVSGADAARRLSTITLLATTADSIGGCGEILDRTVAYMKERVQFGRPIASFQALKHRIADIAVERTICEHLLSSALDQQVSDETLHLWACIAKADAGEAYLRSAADCLLLHGGVGFTWEFDPHIYLKRARLNSILGGDERRLRDTAAELIPVPVTGKFT